AGVAVEFRRSAREDGGAHVTVVVQTVDAVDVERVAEHAADEVLDRDAAGDAERVLLEIRDALFEGRDGSRLLCIGSLEGRDAVTQGDLVTTQEGDELAKVRDVAPVALDGASQASRVGATRRSHGAA